MRTISPAMQESTVITVIGTPALTMRSSRDQIQGDVLGGVDGGVQVGADLVDLQGVRGQRGAADRLAHAASPILSPAALASRSIESPTRATCSARSERRSDDIAERKSQCLHCAAALGQRLEERAGEAKFACPARERLGGVDGERPAIAGRPGAGTQQLGPLPFLLKTGDQVPMVPGERLRMRGWNPCLSNATEVLRFCLGC